MSKHDEPIDVQPEEQGRDLMSLNVEDPDFNADKAIELATQRITFMDKIRTASLKMTRHNDWVRHNQGRDKQSYYLQSTGAEKLRGIWGIYWHSIKIENFGTKDEPIYEVQGTIGSKVLKTEIEVVGGRSSQDKFYQDQRDPLDILDVRKAAVSNWMTRAIQILIGCRNPTAKDLEDAGIDLTQVSGVDFKEDNQAAYNSDQKAQRTEKSEEQRKKIGSMIMEIVGGDKEEAKAYLQKMTEFKNKDGDLVPGKTSIAKLTVKQIPFTYKKVKEIYEAEFAGMGDEEE
jgi:hypothetical protein